MSKHNALVVGLLCVFVFFLFLCGCRPLRKYGSSEDGFVGVLFKNQFGQGKAMRDYFITDNDEIINVGDTSKRVLDIMGVPDKDEHSLGGYRIWEYKNSNVEFYIDKERVKYIYVCKDRRIRNGKAR